MLLTNSLGKIDLTIGNEVTKNLVNTGATLSVLNPINLSVPLPWNTETVKMVAVSNKPVTVFKSLPVPFQLETIEGTHPFLLVPSVPIHLLERDFLEAHKAYISFFQKGEIFLHIEGDPNSHNSPGDSSIKIPVFLVSMGDSNPLLDTILDDLV